MATLQLYCIAPSPLVKICLPEWEARLAKSPDLIFDDKTPFEILVDSGSRTFRVPFNTPLAIVYADPKFIADRNEISNSKVQTCKLAPAVAENVIYVRDPRDLESTFNFLTGQGGGVAARQTDSYGIVAFDPENSIVRNFEELGLVDDLLSDDPQKAAAAKDRLVATKLAAAKRQRDVYQTLVEKSEERIKRHLRMTHNNLMAQWQKNEEQKLGKYPPSLSERLGFKVLDPEIKAKDDMTAETARIANEMMQRKVVG